MTTVKDILDYIYTLAPVSMKMNWDNVGLLCGSSSKEVHTVLVALDPFESVAQEASKIGADLLVTHHPLIFQPVKELLCRIISGVAVLLELTEELSRICSCPKE